MTRDIVMVIIEHGHDLRPIFAHPCPASHATTARALTARTLNQPHLSPPFLHTEGNAFSHQKSSLLRALFWGSCMFLTCLLHQTEESTMAISNETGFWPVPPADTMQRWTTAPGISPTAAHLGENKNDLHAPFVSPNVSSSALKPHSAEVSLLRW